ncbi:MAG: hypothetical protein HN736_18335 [Anaerolineae bacterium]|jgi:hypothetical protein|nr:hypothetical protein [Anaerolineae bacterium]MBT3713545.1 hypothetical protein [Anaerolineae bacterium]MBT4311824.1 hypothetical protein [Anaerolineae bacterium]MBT4456670.1 hypothetical protein [Anaerolineae bacterium]MBT4843316.1 hypothetical protein [Anaerolineae bacterium]
MIGRMKERAKLVRPLLVPLMFYIGFLAFSFSWLEENQGSSWRITVALLPMLPGIFIALGIGKAIQQLDEMERIILQKGMAISFAATLLLLITMGLLKTAGIEQLGSTYIVLFMIIVWLLAKLWGHWRYQ